MSDGHLNKCKTCTKKDVRTNRADNVDYYREYDQVRGRGNTTERSREYRARYPKKYAAHSAVAYAVKSGTLVPQVCEVCSDVKSTAHHDDYDKPLSVRGCVRLITQLGTENTERELTLIDLCPPRKAGFSTLENRMRYEIGKPKPEKWSWDVWFAWYPVFTRPRDGKKSLVWLEHVDRMYRGGRWHECYVYEVKSTG